ncbi:unnamed protein product [Amoebophrya sp. A25]|nr:unnamed protein product [Amoebophrya sp. A25]|eukprot:GSA25T00021217001.1
MDDFDDLFNVDAPEENLPLQGGDGDADDADANAKRRKLLDDDHDSSGGGDAQEQDVDVFGIGKSTTTSLVNPLDLEDALGNFDGDRLTALSEEALKSFEKRPQAGASSSASSSDAVLFGGATSSSSTSKLFPTSTTSVGKRTMNTGAAAPAATGSSSSSSSLLRPNALSNISHGRAPPAGERERLLPAEDEAEEVASLEGRKAPSSTHSLFSGYGSRAAVEALRAKREANNISSSKSKKQQASSSSRSIPEQKMTEGHLRGVMASVRDHALLNGASGGSSSSSANQKALVATGGVESAMHLSARAGRPPNVLPVIHNCVASFHLKCKIDLQEATFKARNIEYNPKKAPSLIVRQRDPRATALVYETGRVMITGAANPEDAKLAGKKTAKLFQAIGYKEAKFVNYQLENLVAIADLGFPIRLEGVAFDYRDQACYEPELFAGLVWKQWDPQISCLIFVSGKMVMTGGKSTDDMYTVLDELYPKLFNYQK